MLVCDNKSNYNLSDIYGSDKIINQNKFSTSSFYLIVKSNFILMCLNENVHVFMVGVLALFSVPQIFLQNRVDNQVYEN